ncbi:DUF5447 family protein [Pseudomonas sp. 21]|uniref:lysogeny maintenance protein PflM n=1 Tax=Pseudomonas sp. 21 TaxID=1619948 RepID=UPI000AA469D2
MLPSKYLHRPHPLDCDCSVCWSRRELGKISLCQSTPCTECRPTGYIPSKSNADLLLEAERKGWMGGSAAKTPVTVKPKVTIPVSEIGSKLKAGLKTNAGQLAMSAAISGAIAGVGWVMSDDNTKIQKKDPGTAPETVNTTDGTYYWKYAPVSNSAASTPLASCVIVGTSTLHPYHGHFVSKVNDTRYTCAYYDQFDRLMGPFSYIDRSGTHCATGYTWDAVTASCLSPEQKKDLSESDPLPRYPRIAGCIGSL